MTVSELSAEIRRLLATEREDKTLRGALEKLAEKEIAFDGFTWLWGPELYKRNRTLFRPFILSQFSRWMRVKRDRVEEIRFRKHGDVLEAWLRETDRRDDAELFRKLYEWKLSDAYSLRKREQRAAEICSEITRRLARISTVAEGLMVLRKMDLGFRLDEPAAQAIYRAMPKGAEDFILRNLPNAWYLGSGSRELWEKLFAAADDDLRWRLYRKQAPVDRWESDVAKLASEVADPAQLCAELNKRHPEGWYFDLDLTSGLLSLLQARGRDVFPYVVRRLGSIRRGLFWKSKNYKQILALCEKEEWWDLWTGLTRVAGSRLDFSNAVLRWIEAALPDDSKRERLAALAGVSREWNLPGLGIATVHPLTEKAALALYERYPDLLRSVFRQHVAGHIGGEAYPKLLEQFLASGDEEMIDITASRVATRIHALGKGIHLAMASRLADYYLALKNDEAVFARRAGRALGLIPAYSIGRHDQLIRENRLARLFFDRSLKSMLADKAGLLDLVEASEIHVQAMAYRALGLNDPRAREAAGEQLPLLLGTLLRPLHRETRRAAFGALANAAQTLAGARLVLEGAREALVLPDEKYPKEQLLGLIARLLHQWPELRGPAEQPVIYERAAA